MWRKRGPGPQARLRVGELTLRRAARVRFLGVWVDAGLGWDGHRRQSPNADRQALSVDRE